MKSLFDLSSRVVLATGANRGIGLRFLWKVLERMAAKQHIPAATVGRWGQGIGEGDPTVPQAVNGKIVVRDVGQCPDAVLLDFCDVVDAAFEVAPSLQFGLLGDGLRR